MRRTLIFVVLLFAGCSNKISGQQIYTCYDACQETNADIEYVKTTNEAMFEGVDVASEVTCKCTNKVRIDLNHKAERQ